MHFLKEKNVTVYCCCTYASHCILGKLHKVLYTLSVKNTATTKKKFFNRWNIFATAQEIKRQHSKLSFIKNRSMSPIITTPYKRKKPKMKTYGRKPSAPKVRFNSKKSPAALLERKMNVVLRL